MSLRQMLQDGASVIAPGVGDGLTAKLVQAADFPVVYMSGFVVSATMGYPDIGLVTMPEMIERARSVAEAVTVPVIADADGGHGTEVNVVRTVRGMEKAGVAAIHLEDQKLPKRCGAMAGIELISIPDMCNKLATALETRTSPEFLIIGRTDAIAAAGIDEAIARGKAYRDVGADAVMVQSPRSVDDLLRFRDAVDGPLVVTMGTWNLQVSPADLAGMGYQVVLYPLSTLRRAARAVFDSLQELRRAGTLSHDARDMFTVPELNTLLGLDRWRDLERH